MVLERPINEGYSTRAGVAVGKPSFPGVSWETVVDVYDRDFPGDPVIKNPPANAWDTSSIPGPRRSHMTQGSQVHVPRQLSPHTLQSMPCNKRSHCKWGAHALQLESSPHFWQPEKGPS